MRVLIYSYRVLRVKEEEETDFIQRKVFSDDNCLYIVHYRLK